MDREEILSSVYMPEILSRYGIKPNRANMCSCPFHGTDKHPSMKIYKDGFKCFACGEYGNVIDFVMKYENIDFKSAYISLGGEYATTTDKERRIAEMSRKRAKEERERKSKAEEEFKKELSYCISLCRACGENLEPFSDEWCFFANALPKLLEAWRLKYEEQEGVDEINVIRICRQVRRTIATIA